MRNLTTTWPGHLMLPCQWKANSHKGTRRFCSAHDTLRSMLLSLVEFHSFFSLNFKRDSLELFQPFLAETFCNFVTSNGNFGAMAQLRSSMFHIFLLALFLSKVESEGGPNIQICLESGFDGGIQRDFG